MKRISCLLLTVAVLASATSCSKEKDATPAGPKEYQVAYRISSSTLAQSDFVSYTNDAGGTTILNNVALPASYSFKRTMKQGDHVNVAASISSGAPAASDITASILLDGKEVKKETSWGAGAQVAPTYVIGE